MNQAAGSGGQSSQRVLVVDDERDVLELILAVLERAGIAYLAARDGEEALRTFFDEKPDAVLLDVVMPGLHGWEVLERIREVSDVPVLMLSARSEQADAPSHLRARASDFMAKPFSCQELGGRVRRLLQYD